MKTDYEMKYKELLKKHNELKKKAEQDHWRMIDLEQAILDLKSDERTQLKRAILDLLGS